MKLNIYEPKQIGSLPSFFMGRDSDFLSQLKPAKFIKKSRELSPLKPAYVSLVNTERYKTTDLTKISEELSNIHPDRDNLKKKLSQFRNRSTHRGSATGYASHRTTVEDLSGRTSRLRDSYDEIEPPRLHIVRSSSTSNIYENDGQDDPVKNFLNRIEKLKDAATGAGKHPLIDDETTKEFHMMLSSFRISLEKAGTHFMLFPDTDRKVVEAMIEAHTFALKLMRKVQIKCQEIMKHNHECLVVMQMAQEDALKARTEREIHHKIHFVDPFQGENQELKKKMEALKEESEKNSRIWLVEKSKLEAEVDILKKKIYEFTASHPFEALKTEFEGYIQQNMARVKGFEENIEKRQNRIYKLEMDIQSEKIRTGELDDTIERQGNKIVELTAKNLELSTRLETAEDLMIQYREGYGMRNEEVYLIEGRIKQLTRALIEADKKNSAAQKKLDYYGKYLEERGMIVEEETKRDAFAMKNLKAIYSTLKHVILKNREGQAQSDKQTQEELKMSSDPNSAKLSLYRPTFYNLIERIYVAKIDNPLDEVLVTDKELICIIRAILDSKFNEVMYCQNSRAITNFADFVYGWIGTFTVDKESRQVRLIALNDEIDVNSRRMNLYQALRSKQLNGAWDVNIFREFMEEQYTTDEICFYLYCRYLLFQGSQLDHIGGALNMIHYVVFERAERLIDQVFYKMNHEQTGDIKNQIKLRTKVKYSKLLVDSGFVLTSLLECYRTERNLVYKQTQQEFHFLSDNPNPLRINVPFHNFKAYLDGEFQFLSEASKSRLYRETASYGNGLVNADSFFMAATESNLFVDILKNKYFTDMAPSTLAPLKNQQLMQLDHLQTTLSKKYDQYKDIFKYCQKFVANLGVDSILAEVEQHTSILASKLLNGEALAHRFDLYLQVLIKSRNQFIMMHKNTYHDKKEIVEAQIQGSVVALEAIEHYAKIDEADETDKSKKIRKFQKFFRKKSERWFALLNNVMGTIRKSPKSSKRTTPATSRRSSIADISQAKRMSLKMQLIQNDSKGVNSPGLKPKEGK